MTLPTNLNKHTYIGNGVQTEFPYTFPILTETGTDIEVYLYNATTAVTTQITSGFTVDTVNSLVTYPTVGDPISSTYKITLLRVEALTQETDLVNNAAFYAEVIEDALDKLTAIDQQLYEELGRALKLPVSSSDSGEETVSDLLVASQTAVNSAAAAVVSAAEAAASAVVAQNHIDQLTGAHAATAIANTPSGTISSITVQAAINELGAEKSSISQLQDYSFTPKTDDIITKDPWADIRAFGAVGDGVTGASTFITAAAAASNRVFIPDGIWLIDSTITISNNVNLQLSPNAELLINTDIDGIVLKKYASIVGGKINVTINNYSHTALTLRSLQGEGEWFNNKPMPAVSDISICNTATIKLLGTGLKLEAYGTDTTSYIVCRRFNNITINSFYYGIYAMAGDGTGGGIPDPHPYINGNMFNNIFISACIVNIYTNTNKGEIGGNQFSNLQIQCNELTINLINLQGYSYENAFYGIKIWDYNAVIDKTNSISFGASAPSNYLLNNIFTNQYGNLTAGIVNLGANNVVHKTIETMADLTISGNLKLAYSKGIKATGYTYDDVLKTGYGTSDYVKLYTPGAAAADATPKITMISSGKVAIGDFNPVYTLDVATGFVNSVSGYKTNGADYGEFFESIDGTRLDYGITVVLEGGKVRPAIATDDTNLIFGVVSATCSLIGDSGTEWQGKFITDDYGIIQCEDTETIETIVDNMGAPLLNADGTYQTKVIIVKTPIINPEYDPTKIYVLREDRPEWNTIGFMGKLRVTKGKLINPNWVYMYDISDNVAMYLIK